MKLENKVGQKFDSLAQRVLYSYVAAYPVFIPLKDNAVSEESQKQMYDFLYASLRYVYDNPEILGITDQEDNCYENWQLNNSNPELISAMEKIEYKFAAFYEVLIKIGLLGEIHDHELVIQKTDWSISKTTADKLSLLGLTVVKNKADTVLSMPEYPEIFDAWKLYSMNDDSKAKKITRVVTFIHGGYLERRYKAADFFTDLIDNVNVLTELESYLLSNGFDYLNAEPSTQTRYSCTKWIKEYGKKEVAYMKIYFDWRKKNQMIFEFRLPQFRLLLNSYEDMDTELKKFVFNRLKNCDQCGYCTQTDKSGTRERLTMALSCENETKAKCPLYPNFTWNYMDGDDLHNMMKLFEFSEQKANI